ncbi:MAG TPA: LysE family translocator [bacterium]|nr:LysE family translocator [bacterium]
MDHSFFLRGLIVGFSIAAPVGPIGVLCIRRTLAEGRAVGFISGLGAATADGTYGLIAAFGLTSIAAFFVGHQLWLRVVGGAFLLFLGYKTLAAHPAVRPAVGTGDTRLVGAYSSTLFLTLTNPMTILSFAAVFAGLGLGTAAGDYRTAGVLVLGVFLGSALWWGVLSGLTGMFRSRFDRGGLRWVNMISGTIITAFGVAAIAAAGR